MSTPSNFDPSDSFKHKEESPMLRNEPPKVDRSENSSFSTKFKEFGERQHLSHFLDYANQNVREMMSYALLTLGLLLLFVLPLLGQTLVGIVIAIYFGAEILGFFMHYDLYIQQLGTTRSLVIAGALLALCIEAPFIIVGVAVMLVFRYLLLHDQLPPE